MRPIARPAAAAGWVAPLTVDLSRSASAGAVRRVFGTDRPTTADCLDLWDDEASGARALNPDERAALDAVKAKVGTLYGPAMPDLIDVVGAFCAYCELPLHDPSQLEHALPKSQYPTFALSWDNFLPACVGCNSRKRELPLRSTVAGWLGVTSTAPAQCEQEIRDNRFRWPDRHPLEGYVGVRLEYDDGGGWQPCDLADSVAPATSHVETSLVRGEVLASVQGLPGHVPVAAVVFDARGDAQTSGTIDLCKLDRRPVSRDASDKRTVRRTEVWLQAVRALHEAVSAGVPATLPGTVADQVVWTGFWRVWVTVAELIDPQLRKVLVVATQGRLAGTDATRIP